MGKIRYGLRQFTEPSPPELCDQDRQNNRRRKTYDKSQQIYHYRVLQHQRKLRICQELAKIFQSHKISADEPRHNVKILKSDADSIHGQITEYKQENQSRPYHRLYLQLSL